MPLRRIQALFLAAVFLCGVGCAGKNKLKIGKTAEGEVVEAEGLAAYDSKDLIHTKRASLLDAQRNAVEKAVGVYVSAKTFVEKAIAIENNILANTEGYVKKYDIVSEGVDEGLYKTRIRALVALKDLEKDLQDMSLLKTKELERPRVSVGIDDQNAMAAVQQKLLDNGYIIVEKNRKKDADLELLGKAAAFPFQTENLGGFVSYRARISLQAKRPGTDDVVLSLSKEASGLGGSAELAAIKALETVGDLIGTEAAERLAEVWNKNKNVLISVEGVTSFAEVDRIKKNLSAQPGIEDIALRFFEEQMAQFEAALGSVQISDLAARLEAGKSISYTVIEAKPQTLRLKLN